MAIKNVPAQSPRICIAYMVHPALYARIQFGEGDRAAFIGVDVVFQAAREVHGVALLEFAMRRVDDEAQPGDAILCLRDLRFAFSASYSTTDNQNALYDTETGRIRPSFTFPVSDNGRLNVFYQYEYTDISDVDPAASEIIVQEAGLGGVGINSVGYQYSFDTRRSGLNPSAGVLLRFGQEFGFGTDTQFIRTTALASAETRVLQEEVTLRATIRLPSFTSDIGTQTAVRSAGSKRTPQSISCGSTGIQLPSTRISVS